MRDPCATCGAPLRILDGAVSGSGLPKGWHHGLSRDACDEAAKTDYSACFDVAWRYLAEASAGWDEYWQATLDESEDRLYTRQEIDKLLGRLQNAVWEGLRWGNYPRHGKPPEILRRSDGTEIHEWQPDHPKNAQSDAEAL